VKRELPDDTKRFEELNVDVKEILVKIAGTKKVLPSCTLDGLYARLVKVEAALTKCEKSLNAYLDSKVCAVVVCPQLFALNCLPSTVCPQLFALNLPDERVPGLQAPRVRPLLLRVHRRPAGHTFQRKLTGEGM
jgi:hypothetical protein